MQQTDQQKETRIHLNVTKIIHSPTLSTVLMVEDTLRKQDGPVSLEGLKRALPKKVMDQSLRIILAYLENKGSILMGPKGVTSHRDLPISSTTLIESLFPCVKWLLSQKILKQAPDFRTP